MLNDQSITSPHNELQRSPGFFQKRPPEVFYKKMCSWKFRKFHMKSPVLEPLFNNVAGLQACNFIEKILQHWCFPMKFVKFLITPILKNIWERLFLGAWGEGEVVFAVGREMKIFSTVSQDFGKNMVGKRDFQRWTVPVITGKNNEKSEFEIIKNGIAIFGHLLKKLIFCFYHLSGFWNTLKTFEISECYAVICKCQSIFILHSLTKHSNIWCIVTRRTSWFLLLFDKHFSNCLQMPSKYSNTMLSICKVSLRKIS